MAERLTPQPKKASGVNRATVRLWALVCLTLGTMGLAVIQNGLLKLPTMDGQALLAAMEANPRVMGYATVALVLQAICCCAVPLFAFLLAEGFERTGSFGKYFLRVLGVAVLCELPFNLAAEGKWLATTSRNPAVALVLALLMLWFFRNYSNRSFGHYAIRAVVAVAAVLWSLMLNVQEGAPLVILTAVFWGLRKKKVAWMVFGCVAAFACSIFSPFYLLSPMVFILLHFYNGEAGEENVWAKHLAYPAILLILGIVATYVI